MLCPYTDTSCSIETILVVPIFQFGVSHLNGFFDAERLLTQVFDFGEAPHFVVQAALGHVRVGHLDPGVLSKEWLLASDV